MPIIGFLGGTGDLGRALAVNVFKDFDQVLVGSRILQKARTAVEEINSDKMDARLEQKLVAATNDEVAADTDVVIATIPHENAVDTVRSLSTKFKGNQLLISAVAPVVKIGSEFRSFLPNEKDSISKIISQTVPESVAVATAFQTIPAKILYNQREIDADVLVCASLQTYPKVAAIVNQIKGLRSLHVGSLELAGQIEGLTAILLNVAIKNHLKSPTLKLHSF